MGTPTITLDAQTAARVRRHVGSQDPALLIARPRSSWRPGVSAAVRAFGAWRFGIIVKVTRTRATVAYVTPSNPDVIRFATTADVRIGAYWKPACDEMTD